MTGLVVVASLLLLLLSAAHASAVDSLLAEPSCVDYLKLRCANAGTAAVSKLDILECIQLYEVIFYIPIELKNKF